MRKVLFLMFLLLLMGLGAAAQVRIGGNGAPNAAAVLDLNVDNADTGNKGALALPRISLGALSGASANLNGVAPIKGMLVYNTNATLGAGLYYWSGDSSKWVEVINSDFTVPLSKIVTTQADSGFMLISNGTSVVPLHGFRQVDMPTPIQTMTPQNVTSVQLVVNQLVTVKLTPWTIYKFPQTGLTGSEECFSFGSHAAAVSYDGTGVWVYPVLNDEIRGTYDFIITCYRFNL